MSSAAAGAVSTGAAGSAPMSRRTAESRRAGPMRSRQDSCRALTCSSKRPASSTARWQAAAISAIQRFRPACASAEPGSPS